VFGGNSSSEIRVTPLGASNFQPFCRETGIIEEIMLDVRATNHMHFHDHGMINSLYDLTLLDALRREPNLTIFLNTSVREVEIGLADANDATSPRSITALRAIQLGSEKQFRFRAKQFADCTGDGTVGFLAGADYRYGREGRHEHGEHLAPAQADNVTMGSTITMHARDYGRPCPFTPPAWAKRYTSLEDIGPARVPFTIRKSDYGGYWWLEVGSPFHQIEQTDEVRDVLHAHVLGVWYYIKNHSPDREHAINYGLEWIGMTPGKRESRRLLGDVIVTERDCIEGTPWHDRTSIVGWFIDLHIKGGILNKQEPGELSHTDRHYKYYTRLAPFALPLRAMYSRNVTNLWMAGRNISTTHVALGCVRNQLTTGNMGQVIGTAAAIALRHDVSPRALAADREGLMRALQQQLLHDDLQILGLRNKDPHDLAPRARASASSEAPYAIGEPTGKWHPLDTWRGQVVPVTASRMDTGRLLLRNDTGGSATVTLEVHELENIWARSQGKQVHRQAVTVPAHQEGWLEVPFGCDLTPGMSHRIALSPTAGVSWAEMNHRPHGTMPHFVFESPGGCEPNNRHLPSLIEIDLPPFRRWYQSTGFLETYIAALGCTITPPPAPCGAANVNNGFAWPEAMPNLWASHPAQPLPQWLELRFERPTELGRVLISFDTQLGQRISQMPEFWRAPECAKHWRLLIESDGRWIAVHEETDNHQRRRTVRFEPRRSAALRVEVLATHGAPSARIYDIRAYGQ